MSLHSTVGVVALAAVAVAAISLLTCVFLAVRLRRIRIDQLAVMGDGELDLVGHAAAL
jgi:hypothetical protein